MYNVATLYITYAILSKFIFIDLWHTVSGNNHTITKAIYTFQQ